MWNKYQNSVEDNLTSLSIKTKYGFTKFVQGLIFQIESMNDLCYFIQLFHFQFNSILKDKLVR